jgi:SnoaL-like protein
MTTIDETQALEQRLATLEERLAAAELTAGRAQDRGAVENVFNRYMHYHNAYQDERIIDELWVEPGTPDIRSRYDDVGAYTTYESVTAYHRGRPQPVGKPLFHHTSTPVVEVRADGWTAKGIWIAAGLESGLMDPEVATGVPPCVLSGGDVDGKPVWAHWVWCTYGVDFVKQDGEWRIWHFRCYEVARAPFDRDWDQLRRGRPGEPRLAAGLLRRRRRPVFPPQVDEPVTTTDHHPYANDRIQTLDPEPPVPYTEFEDTFR